MGSLNPVSGRLQWKEGRVTIKHAHSKPDTLEPVHGKAPICLAVHVLISSAPMLSVTYPGGIQDLVHS